MTTSASAAGVAAGRPAVAAAASTPEQQQAVPQANPALAHSEVLLATSECSLVRTLGAGG